MIKPDNIKPDTIKPESMTPVPSPCISICEMNPEGLCKGCLRTIEEIAGWSKASDDDKRAVWAQIRRREESIDFQ